MMMSVALAPAWTLPSRRPRSMKRSRRRRGGHQTPTSPPKIPRGGSLVHRKPGDASSDPAWKVRTVRARPSVAPTRGCLEIETLDFLSLRESSERGQIGMLAPLTLQAQHERLPRTQWSMPAGNWPGYPELYRGWPRSEREMVMESKGPRK